MGVKPQQILTTSVILVQLSLGVILFFIINWIGKHSYSVGYMQISMFLQKEEAPAFNFFYRIISPIVYLFITSAILYKLGLDEYTEKFYLVAVYYLVFRLSFNLITNRALLMNWYRQGLYWVSILSLSYLAYDKIIYRKENILPDFGSLANELWIIIFLFLFQTLNQVRLSSERTLERKHNYLQTRLQKFKSKYGHVIDELVENEKLKSIVYAIMIYEDFNRPKVVRGLEYVSYYWHSFFLTKKVHTLGLMQVATHSAISDLESVRLGTEKIVRKSKELLDQAQERIDAVEEEFEELYPHTEWSVIRAIITDYNPDDDYATEVIRLREKISELLGVAEVTLLPKR